MADFMLGTWKFTSTDDNFEKYAKEVGKEQFYRKIHLKKKKKNSCIISYGMKKNQLIYLHSSDTYGSVVKAVIGVGFAQRKIAAQAKPDVTVTKGDDGKWTFTTTTSFHKSAFSFNLGEPFMHDTIDGKKAKTVLTLDGNTLTMKEAPTGDRDETTVIRVFNGDTMNAKFICNGVVSERVYTRTK